MNRLVLLLEEPADYNHRGLPSPDPAGRSHRERRGTRQTQKATRPTAEGNPPRSTSPEVSGDRRATSGKGSHDRSLPSPWNRGGEGTNGSRKEYRTGMSPECPSRHRPPPSSLEGWRRDSLSRISWLTKGLAEQRPKWGTKPLPGPTGARPVLRPTMNDILACLLAPLPAFSAAGGECWSQDPALAVTVSQAQGALTGNVMHHTTKLKQ